MLSRLIDALLPGLCLMCDLPLKGTTVQLCAHCLEVLPWNQPCCERCAAPLDSAADSCADCLGGRPSFDRAVAPLRFQGVVQSWVHALKFHHGLAEGRVLAELLARCIRTRYARSCLPDVVVPVPLSRRRLARRGHNQALTIALVTARRLGMRVNRSAVRRIRHTAPQTAKTSAQRRANVSHAFASRPWPGTRIALVDDVMTTGATTDALARVLLEAGAGAVHVWTTARTPPPC